MSVRRRQCRFHALDDAIGFGRKRVDEIDRAAHRGLRCVATAGANARPAPGLLRRSTAETRH
jgi:hypothetical protein